MTKNRLESPIIQGYGEVVYFKDAYLQPDKIREYKAVFSIATNDDPNGVSPQLQHVALLLNILETSGVPKDKTKVAIVISGNGIDIALKDDLYLKKYGNENPNMDILKKLYDNGVEIFVCAQSLVEFGLTKDDINQYTLFSLSALTDLLILQQQGYILLA